MLERLLRGSKGETGQGIIAVVVSVVIFAVAAYFLFRTVSVINAINDQAGRFDIRLNLIGYVLPSPWTGEDQGEGVKLTSHFPPTSLLPPGGGGGTLAQPGFRHAARKGFESGDHRGSSLPTKV